MCRWVNVWGECVGVNVWVVFECVCVSVDGCVYHMWVCECVLSVSVCECVL